MSTETKTSKFKTGDVVLMRAPEEEKKATDSDSPDSMKFLILGVAPDPGDGYLISVLLTPEEIVETYGSTKHNCFKVLFSDFKFATDVAKATATASSSGGNFSSVSGCGADGSDLEAWSEGVSAPEVIGQLTRATVVDNLLQRFQEANEAEARQMKQFDVTSSLSRLQPSCMPTCALSRRTSIRRSTSLIARVCL